MKKLFIILGGAGVGKSDIVSYCQNRYGFNFIKKCTTRKMRKEEIESPNKAGGDLIFSDIETFNKEDPSQILSYIYGGQTYWLKIDDVKKAAANHDNNIIIFSDFEIVKKLKKVFSSFFDLVQVLFIYAEDSLLVERLKKLDYTDEQIKFRLNRSKHIWQQYVDYGNTLIDYTIINNQDKNVLYKLLDNIILKSHNEQ